MLDALTPNGATVTAAARHYEDLDKLVSEAPNGSTINHVDPVTSEDSRKLAVEAVVSLPQFSDFAVTTLIKDGRRQCCNIGDSCSSGLPADGACQHAR